MKLRINAKLRAALIAAVSVVGYTITSAQAADITLANVMNQGIDADTAATTTVWGDTDSILSTVSAQYHITNGGQNPTQTNYTRSFLATKTNVGSNGQQGRYTYTLTFKTAETLANPVTLSSINVDFVTFNGGGVGHNQGGPDYNKINCTWTLTETAGGTLQSVELPDNGVATKNSAAYTRNADGTYTSAGFTGATANIDFEDFALAENTTYTLTLAVSKAAGADGFFVGIGNIALINTPAVQISTWNGTAEHSTWGDTDSWSGTPFVDGGAAVFDGNATVKTATVNANVTADSVTVSGAEHTFNLSGGNLTTGALTIGEGGSLALTGTGTVTASAIDASGKTINIGSDAVLTGTGSATLAGTGTYALASGSQSLGNISLSSEWTGTVRISNVGSDSSKVGNLQTVLSGLSNNNKGIVEVKNVVGWLGGNVSTNIKLGGTGTALRIADGSSGQDRVFSGTVTGTGDFEYSWAGGSGQEHTFSGDIAGWTGSYKDTGNGTAYNDLEFTGSATVINASVLHGRMSDMVLKFTNDSIVTMNGTISSTSSKALNVQANASVTFNQAVTATTLTVADNKSVTFNGAATVANGVTMGNGASITVGETGSLTMGGTVTFGGDAITNNGTVNFGSNLVFNLNGLEAVETDNVHTYTLFTGNDVDMTSLGIANVSIDGGTAGKIWNFETPGKISWTLASSVAWNGGSEGVWDYETQNWGEPAAAFTRGCGAEFNSSANVTVAAAIEADTIVVAQGAEVNLIAGEQGTLQAQGVSVNGTLTTGLTVSGMSSYAVAEGGTWNINANQTLGTGTNAGIINVGADARVTVTENALSVVNGMTNHGTVALTLSGDSRLEMNAASDGTVELAGGTLDYRSELGTQTIKLTGTKLLFGTKKGSEAIDTIFDHDIVLGANTTIQVHGTSQHKSVTINGTITGNYDLTKTDGNQTTTFAGKVTVNKLSTAADSTGKTVIAAGAEIANNLAPVKGTMELHGDVNIGNDLDLSIGNSSEATVVIASDGNVSSNNMWMRSVAHIDLQKDGQLTLRAAGLKLVGLEGGGSITTTAGNVSYGANRNDFTITAADVTVTQDGVTLGNKLTNSSLAIGNHSVTVSNTGNTLTGLTYDDGATLTLNGNNVINGITTLVAQNGTTLNLGSGKQDTVTLLTINDGGVATSSRGGAASGFLANNGAIVINGGGTLKLTGGNDALGYGGGHVVSVTMNGTAEHVAKLDMTGQSGSETMATNLILNGYAEITDSSNQHGFNTYGGTITATGTNNSIARIEIRSDATFNVTGEGDTLTVGIMTLSSQSANKFATKTGAGTLTFTDGAAAKKLIISQGAVVLGGDSAFDALDIATGGSLQIVGGTTTVNGDANVINETIALGEAGHLTMTGHYDIGSMSFIGTPTYENGGSEHIAAGNGFLKHDGTVQVVQIAAGEEGRLVTEGATFSYGSDSGSLNADGTFSLNGEVDYAKLYVNNNDGVSYAAAWDIAQGQQTEISAVEMAAGTTLTADKEGAAFALVLGGSATVNATAATTLSSISGWENNTLTISGTGGVTLPAGDLVLTGSTKLDVQGKATTNKIQLNSDEASLVIGTAGDLTISGNNNLTPTKGTVEIAGKLYVGHEIDLSNSSVSTGKITLHSGADVTVKDGMWMNYTSAGILLEEGAKLAITGKGVTFIGKEGGLIKAADGKEINYQATNDNAVVKNVIMEATGDITINNQLTNVDVVTGAHTVTLNRLVSSVTVSENGGLVVNVDMDLAGNLQSSGAITVNAEKTLTLGAGSTVYQTITNSGTVSLTGITLGGGFSEQQGGEAHFNAAGEVTLDANYYIGTTESYVQVVANGDSATSTGTGILWQGTGYGLETDGRIITGHGSVNYGTYYITDGRVNMSDIMALHSTTDFIVSDNGTLVVDQETQGQIHIDVKGTGTITGDKATPEDVQIETRSTAEFTKDVAGVGYEFKVGDAAQGEMDTVTITNFGEESAKYTAENPDMMVSTQTLKMTDTENDAVVTNKVWVNEIVNVTGRKLTLENEDMQLIESMTIGAGSTVAVYETDEQAAVEGTVTITESLTAGGATLLANLTIADVDVEDGVNPILNVNGGGDNALTLGSQFGIAEGTLVTLDDATITALEGLQIGGTLNLIKALSQQDQLSYLSDDYDGMWFDALFERTENVHGDYRVYATGESFGLTKVSNVPEPTTGTLSLLALAALAARRRRH